MAVGQRNLSYDIMDVRSRDEAIASAAYWTWYVYVLPLVFGLVLSEAENNRATAPAVPLPSSQWLKRPCAQIANIGMR